MGVSTNKKIVVQRFEREALSGFANPASWLTDRGIELLTVSGSVAEIPYPDIKTVFFVREFRDEEPGSGRRAFLNRPRLDGLWVRLTFRDGDTLEGVMPNNLLEMEAAGLHLIPPDSAQRVFVPRTALRSVQVLGVVGSPLRSRRKKPPTRGQIGLFEETA